ncbi:type I restriction enzyme S subunit [Rhodococcus ruber]|nr:type I restriction enzyme S subunit [Rhodococcus ruber]
MTGGLVVNTDRFLTEEGAASGSSVVPADSVLLSIRAPIGYVARTGMRAAFNQGCRAILPRASVNSRYLTYALVAAGPELESLGRGTTFMELSATQMAALEVPVPSLDEQRAIADYLDRETARIDTLIEEQQRLIEMLRERRAAAIVDAFATMRGDGKGLGEGYDPIPWLPDLRIERVQMRHLCTIGTGSSDSVDAVDEGYPFFVRGNQPLALDHYEFDTEAIITAGDGAMVGRSFHHYRGKFAAHQRVYVLRDFRAVFPRYLFWYFSTYFIRVVGDGGAQATVPSVRMPMIAGMPVPIPPLDEQRRVVEYLDEQTAKIDALIAETERFIELAHERRAALITAAVTGQIDVQEMA